MIDAKVKVRFPFAATNAMVARMNSQPRVPSVTATATMFGHVPLAVAPAGMTNSFKK